MLKIEDESVHATLGLTSLAMDGSGTIIIQQNLELGVRFVSLKLVVYGRCPMSHDKKKMVLNGMLKSFLTSLPILIACGMIFLPKYPSDLTFALAAFIAGFSGVIIIIRNEAPSSFVTIRGMPAVIIGILGTLLFWSSALIILLFE